MEAEERRIQVSVKEQELRLLEGEEVVGRWPVSTSKFGLGSEEGSYRTPLGKFRISEEHGEGEDVGTIFKSRKPSGKWEPGTNVSGDLVLTRILWLEGLEEGNANTKDRYIYIHGTNHEQDIGTPASIGCVRMKNDDIASLFGQVAVGTEVEIA